jgi:hypothetical protein
MAMLAFEISKRQPLAEGRTFGATGPYEQIDGTVHFGVDPTHPDNRSIADIASAPRDSTNAPSFGGASWLWLPARPDRNFTWRAQRSPEPYPLRSAAPYPRGTDP